MSKGKRNVFAVLLTAILAFIFAALLCFGFPVAEAHAEGKTHTVGSQEELKNAFKEAQDGDTITLGENITLSECVVISRDDSPDVNITLDLNDKTIDLTETFKSEFTQQNGKLAGGVAIRIYGDITLTVTGNGAFDGSAATNADDKATEINLFSVQSGATLQIESGNYIIDDDSGACAYAFADSHVVINGGTFQNKSVEDYPYADGGLPLVVNQANVSEQLVTINGGTFKGRNPILGDDNVGGTFVNKEVKIALTSDGDYVVYKGDSVPENASVTYTYNGETGVTATVYDADGLTEAVAQDYSTVVLGENITQSITVAAGRELTLDLNGHTLTNTADSHTITNYGKLTIVDGSPEENGTVDNISHAHGALVNYGEATVSGGTFTRSKEAGISSDDNGGNSWYTLKNYGLLTIKEGTTVTTRMDNGGKRVGAHSSLIANGYQNNSDHTNNHDQVTAGVGDNATLIIEGGSFSGGINTIKNDEGGIAEIAGGTFTNVTQAAVQNWNDLTISGGTFNTKDDSAYAVVSGRYTSEIGSSGDTTITGGTFNGAIVADGTYGADVTYAVSGGEFSEPVSAKYLAEDCAQIASGETFTVGTEENLVDSQNAVAKIEETGVAYTTLQNAINAAAGGETVTLLNGVTLAETLKISNGIVLDLGGKTITSNVEEPDPTQTHAAIFYNGQKNFTIQNGTLVSEGTAIELQGTSMMGRATVTLAEDFKIQSQGVGVYAHGGLKLITSAAITAHSAAIQTHGSLSGITNINVTGGSLTSTNSVAMYLPQKNGTINISGGTIKGMTGVEIRNGTLNVTGGTIVAVGTELSTAPNGSGSTVNAGAAVAVSKYAGNINSLKVNISGGTLQGVYAVYEKNLNADGAEIDVSKLSISLTGGTFDGDVASENVTGFISGGKFSTMPKAQYFAEGYIADGNDFGVYTVKAGTFEIEVGEYKFVGNDLRQAIQFAKDGDTVKLLGDIKATMQVTTVKAEITIDLNGKTVTAANDMLFILDLKAEKDITIKNGSLAGKGIKVVAAAEGVNISISGINIERLNEKYPDESDNMYKGVTPPVLVVGSSSSQYVTNATLEDVEVNVYVDATGSNGHKAVEIYNADVTIENSSVFADSKEGIVINGIAIENSDVVVTGSEIVSTTGSAVGFLGALSFEAAVTENTENFKTLTVENSKLTGYTIALSGDGGAGNSGTVINIVNSQLNSTGKIGPAIYQPQYGIINISGENTVIKGSSGIEIRAGVANISGGAFTADAATFSDVPSGNGTTTDGAAVAVVQHTTKLPVQVNITGGTFKTETEGGKALYQADLQKNGSEAVAKIAMAVSGGTYNGEVSSENVDHFIRGGMFRDLPDEDAFAAGLAGEPYNGYFMVVNAEDTETIASMADRLSAQSELRNYLATFGLTITDVQSVADNNESAASIVAKYAASIVAKYDDILSVSTKDDVAKALISAMDAVDAYIAAEADAFAQYKANEITKLEKELADDKETTDVDESVVLPTATWFALNHAATQAEFEKYLANALAEVKAIRSLRTEISGQTEDLTTLMEILSLSDSAETETLLDKIQEAIDTSVVGVGENPDSDTLAGIYNYLSEIKEQTLDKLAEDFDSLSQTLTAYKTTLDKMYVVLLGTDENGTNSLLKQIQEELEELRGEGDVNTIAGAVTEINRKTEELIQGLKKDLIGENGTGGVLGTIAGYVDDLESMLNGNSGLAAIKTELDSVVSAIGSATDGDTSASGLFALLEAIQSGNSSISSAVTALQDALLGTDNNGAIANLTNALEAAQDDLDSLTGALLEANGGLSTDITDAFAEIDRIVAAIGSLGTAEGSDLATQIGGIVDSLEEMQGTVGNIAESVDASTTVETAKETAFADVETWINAYLDNILAVEGEAGSAVAALAYTAETTEGDIYAKLAQAFSEDNAKLVLRYYNDALAAIDAATTVSEVTTAVSTFKAQVASVEAAAQNVTNVDLTGVYVLLAVAIVLIVAAVVVLLLKGRKESASAVQMAENRVAQPEETPAAEAPVQTETETEPSAEEELAAEDAADDDKDRIVIAANVRSFSEAYMDLDEKQRELFTKVKDYALAKEGAVEVSLNSGVCIKREGKQIVKLTVRRNLPVALFLLENEMLKDFRRSVKSETKLKVRATELAIRDEEDLQTAYTMVDLSIDQIEKDIEAAKERRREARRQRRLQRQAEKEQAQSEEAGAAESQPSETEADDEE